MRIFFIVMVSILLSAHVEANSFDQDQQNSVCTIYTKWYSKPLHAILTNNKWASVVAGSFANTRMSRWFVPKFIKKYNLNTQEFEQQKFSSFNDFFARKLDPAARPIALQTNVVASPADGSVLVVQNIGKNTEFPIKSVAFNIEALLQDKKLAARYKGGTALIIRLAPWDYHRLHFPVSGVPQAHRVIHGKYESVHPFVYSCGVQPLEINERHLVLYQADRFGTIALIPVGALFVGAIKHTYTPDMHYNKGDEMGYFVFGGSTIVLLFQKNTITVSPEIVLNSAAGKETAIKMGQSIAQKIL